MHTKGNGSNEFRNEKEFTDAVTKAYGDSIIKAIKRDDKVDRLKAAYLVYQNVLEAGKEVRENHGLMMEDNNHKKHPLAIMGRRSWHPFQISTDDEKGFESLISKSNNTAKVIDPVINPNLIEMLAATGEKHIDTVFSTGTKILDSNYWSIVMNDAWILANVHIGAIVLIVSPLSWYNLWSQPSKDSWEAWFDGLEGQTNQNWQDAHQDVYNYRMTVTAREYLGLDHFGYTFHRPHASFLLALPPTSYDAKIATFQAYAQYHKANETHDKLYEKFGHLNANLTIHTPSHVVLHDTTYHFIPAENVIRQKIGDVSKVRQQLEQLMPSSVFWNDNGNPSQELNKISGKPLDLRGANLKAVEFKGEFAGDDFMLANLSGAKLHKSDLCGADLRGADLRGADLKHIKQDENTKVTGAIYNDATKFPYNGWSNPEIAWKKVMVKQK